MDNALFGGLVECRLGLFHQIPNGIIASFLGSPYFFLKGLEEGFSGFVSQASYLALFCPFFCRFMIGQLGLAPYAMNTLIKNNLSYISKQKKYSVLKVLSRKT